MLRGGSITPGMSKNLIVGAMQAQTQYGLVNTPLGQVNPIQEKYNVTNRRAIRAILRSPIYGANEDTEMELGIKKISTLNIRNTLNMIGKLALQENTLHNSIF